nr:uncharacterized protein LOC109166029 [Ipomoea trifida]
MTHSIVSSSAATVIPSLVVKTSVTISSSKRQKVPNYQPILQDPRLHNIWKIHSESGLILQRKVDMDDLVANCNIISLLTDQNLRRTVQNIVLHYEWLTVELYANLYPETFNQNHNYYLKTFIHGDLYDLGPATINSFFHRTALEEFEPSLDKLAAMLSHNKPPPGRRMIYPQVLTTVYSVLVRLDICN